MIRLNEDTPQEVLQSVKAGDVVTDTFSKTGLVESVEVIDEGIYRLFRFCLVTGREIVIKK
ncbi:hypothetical protein C7T94_06895 [Pedobacter yulinensis]|uniref:Uncharacterized protein n=1 Tax=Pedobacter yulinensis TaxID=2126353 RepID=A0A2T3HPR8_9SPHI|nr:hypothetical protein [Pedobacter yulinensis]PST84426.1 hypothetical protein C7T94_06895 [Pedobacter yulinensis]